MKKYGYYSCTAVNRGYDSYYYTNPNGRNVIVTAVGDTLDPKGSNYLFEDACEVGEVVDFVSAIKNH